MTRKQLTFTALIALLATTGCGQMANPFSSNPFAHPGTQAQAPRQVPQQNVTEGAVPPAQYASSGGDCNTLATSRMQMYDRPDTYPISDQERKEAYSSLYNACMRNHDWQVAGASHNNVAPSETAQLAALAPAAGGNVAAHGAAPQGTTVNAGGTLVTTSSAPGGGTLIVVGSSGSGAATPAQLSSLSPSSGGNPAGQNSTVVLVQSPQAASAMQGYIPVARTAPLPVAVPIAPPPMATGYTPSTAAAASPQAAAPTHAPSLAGADAAATRYAPQSATANTQLENVLEK